MATSQRHAVNSTPSVVDASSMAPRRSADGALIERSMLGPRAGDIWLEQSLLELAAGGACSREGAPGGEVLFVLAGNGALRAGGRSHPLEPETGAYLPPGHAYGLAAAAAAEMRLVSVRILGGAKDGDPGDDADHAGDADAAAQAPRVRRLADQTPQSATASRQFRIIFDPASGLRSATHFVGYIPVGRAPDHYHTYAEVIYVLEGKGAFHIARRSWPVRGGSCIALPARTIHCLENSGPTDMRVVAVFTPPGSPAAAYYPDGTPAYDNHQPLHEEEVQACKDASR